MGEKILLLSEFGLKLVIFWFGMRILFKGTVKRVWLDGIAGLLFVCLVLGTGYRY